MKFDLIEIGEKFGLTPDQTSTGLFVVGILGSHERDRGARRSEEA